MRTAIIGCGAMGTVLGAFLTKSGLDVEMIDTYQAHVDTMKEQGAKIIGWKEFTIPVKAITPDEMSGIYDLVFLFTKQTANHIVLPNLLPYLNEESIVCTLQNGIPEPSVASVIGQERTIGGATNWGATFISPGVSELTQDLDATDHLFDIGEINGQITQRVQNVANILSQMGGDVHVSDSLMASRYGKLVLNACVSGMSAVLGLTFGEVLANPISRSCVSHIGNEVKQVCEAEGYQLPKIGGVYSLDSLSLENAEQFRQSQEIFLEIYKPLPGAKASMLQDLEKGQKTEVAMINGFISETAKKHGIATPFNDRVVDIITRIENGELTYNMDNLAYFTEDIFPYGQEVSLELSGTL